MSTTLLANPPDTLRWRAAFPALILMTLAALFAVTGLRRGERPAPHADVTNLPTVIGTWQMVASEKTQANMAFDPELSKALDLDSYTYRAYQDTVTGRLVLLLFEYRTMGRGGFNHRPEACYPAVGYTLTGRRTVPIRYDGRSGTAITMVADYSGSQTPSHQVLLYWFASGRRCISSFLTQQVDMALGRLQPENNGWAFVRLVCEVPPGDEAGGLAAEKDFVRQASPEIVQAISPAAGH